MLFAEGGLLRRRGGLQKQKAVECLSVEPLEDPEVSEDAENCRRDEGENENENRARCPH